LDQKQTCAAQKAMSALGQKQTCAVQQLMSALRPKADMCSALANVRFGPKADMQASRQDVVQLSCPIKWCRGLPCISLSCATCCLPQQYEFGLFWWRPNGSSHDR